MLPARGGRQRAEGRPALCLKKLTGITDREREVLRLAGLGMSNAEIAAALYITAGTAKTHVARLWPSWAPGTGYSSSSPHTRQAWSRRHTDRTKPE